MKLVDKENLPAYLGGECRCKGSCRESDTGPWNDGSAEGFPIPFWEGFKTRDLDAQGCDSGSQSTL